MSVEEVVITGGGRQTHAQTPRGFLGKCIWWRGLQDARMRGCEDAKMQRYPRAGWRRCQLGVDMRVPKNARVAAGNSKIG